MSATVAVAPSTTTNGNGHSNDSKPEYNSIKRVYAIPIMKDGINTIHNTLSQNAYTQGAYSTAQSIGTQAYQFSEPILAPVLVRADGIANKGLDAVEGRFPYPFQTPTDQVLGDIKSQTDHAKSVATKTIDEKIKAPAYGIAQNVDKSLTPIVDYYETTINKYSSTGSTGEPSSPKATEARSQIERVIILTRDVKDQFLALSAEQLKQLQSQSVIIQRATDAVTQVNLTITSTYNAAKGKGAALSQDASTKVHELSKNMLQELEKLQATTTSLPANIQASLKPLTDAVGSTLTELRGIMSNSESTVSEKASQVAGTVQQQLQPLLEHTQSLLSKLWAHGQVKEEEVARRRDDVDNN